MRSNSSVPTFSASPALACWHARTNLLPRSSLQDDEVFFGSDDDITLAGSTIVRDGPVPMLSLTFDELVNPGEIFAVAFYVDDVGAPDTGFVMSQTPTPIPAPGAVMLALAGFGAIGPVRRWFC